MAGPRRQTFVPYVPSLDIESRYRDWRKYTLEDKRTIYDEPHKENKRAHKKLVSTLSELSTLTYDKDYVNVGTKAMLLTPKAGRAFSNFKAALHVFLHDAIFMCKFIPCLCFERMPQHLARAFYHLEVHAEERHLTEYLMERADADRFFTSFERTIGLKFTDKADYMYPIVGDLIVVRDRIIACRKIVHLNAEAHIPPAFAKECEYIDRFMALEATAYIVYGSELVEDITRFYTNLLAKKDRYMRNAGN